MPGCKYNFSVIAAVVAMKLGFHNPTYRQQNWFAQCGWFPTRSTCNDLINHAVTGECEHSDLLHGGAGGNILIAGGGSNVLRAGRGGDVLVVGSTDQDDDDDALFDLLARWTSNEPLDNRIEDVTNSLDVEFADDEHTTFHGGAGHDLIVADLDDLLRGTRTGTRCGDGHRLRFTRQGTAPPAAPQRPADPDALCRRDPVAMPSNWARPVGSGLRG